MNSNHYRLMISVLVAAILLVAGVLLVSAAPPAPAIGELAAAPLAGSGLSQADGLAGASVYIVRLADEPLATYRGGVARLQATSPRVAGVPRLNVQSPASQAYLSYLASRQTQFMGQLNQVVGRPVEVLHSYRVAFNGLAALLTPAEAARVAGIPGVVSVRQDELKQILTDVTPDFIGATMIWDGSAAGAGNGTQGEGVIVGVVDTGIWPEHPSFADDGSYPAPPEGWAGDCTAPEGDEYTCSNKLIGIRYFLAGYVEAVGEYDGLFLSGRDDDGHGTHTASTAAGNGDIEVTLLGVDRGTISGIAPRAHVAGYKACGPQGCVTSDLVAAIDQAVADGVDVINYSIGGGASNPWEDADALAFLAAREAGIFVATSAGNSGPGPNTLGSPGNAPWLATVGASTSNRHFISEITLSATGTEPVQLWGASVTDGVTDFDLVDAAGIPDSEGDDSGLCLHPFSAGTFQATDVVLCRRGQIARVLRGDYVQAGGGGGVILYNPTRQGLSTDNYVIPAVHVENDVGQQIKDFLAANPDGVKIIFTPGTKVFSAEDSRVVADMMADFSSRGPNGPVPAVIKPDVTAPGVQILAGASPEHAGAGAQGELFQAIQGTSMSSPHVAGAGALLRALHPDWSPAAIQSALMTTARSSGIVKEDGETPADPFDMGAGRIDLAHAADPGLVFDMSVDDYLAGQDDPANMNLSSLGFGNVAGIAIISRTATSLVPADTTWTVSVEAPEGVVITVSPSPLTVPANGTAAFTVSVDATAVPEGQYFAEVDLEHGPHHVHMPVAFVNVPAVWNSLERLETQFDASSADFDLDSGVNQDPFVINAYGLADAVRTDGGPLDQDPDQDAGTDPLGEGFELFSYSLTAADVWFVAQTRDSEIADIDLYLLFDADASGTFEWPGELIGADTSSDADEEVSVALPAAGDYLVAVHAWAGSGTYTLKTYRVTTADDSLTVVNAPATIEPATSYAMQVAWDHQIDEGEEYLGVVTMGSDEDPVAVGLAPVRVFGAVPAVRKSVSADAVFGGDTLDYEIVLANADAAERSMELSDQVPANIAVDPASVTGGAAFAAGRITWSGTLPAATDSVEIGPSAHFGYFSLASLDITPIDIGDPNLDDAAVNFEADPPVSYLGEDYDFVCMVTNGYLVMGGCTSVEDISFTPQNLPDPTVPNNVVAPLWMDFDLDGGDGVGGGTWYAARLTDGVSHWLVFEWENAQRWGEDDTAFTFQVWLKEESEEVSLAYALLSGPTAGSAVGAENDDGSRGAVVYFNDGETEVGTFPTVDDIFDVSGGFRPALHTITYSATAQTDGVATNVATATSGESRDTASASTTVTELPPVPAGKHSLAARVFLDFRCDTYFVAGQDRALAGVPVTLTFSNRAMMTRTTSASGLVLFNGFDASDPVTVTVELPDEYQGRAVGTCRYSRTSVTLTPGDFGPFRSKFITIGADITGEHAGP